MRRVCCLLVAAVALCAPLDASTSTWGPALAGPPIRPKADPTYRQGGGPRREPAPRPTALAVAADQAPTIDGRLDDAVWGRATLIDNFVQEEPVEGAPASEKTEVRVAFDKDQLYFAVYAHYSDNTTEDINVRSAGWCSDWPSGST